MDRNSRGFKILKDDLRRATIEEITNLPEGAVSDAEPMADTGCMAAVLSVLKQPLTRTILMRPPTRNRQVSVSHSPVLRRTD